jgi:crotonobetainyl-CoA:carnitine CoA-transferase CaiB-like acyl-CoA transferase
MMDDPRYVTNARRNANRMSLVAALQEAFLTRTYEEWEAVLLPGRHSDGRDQHHRPGRGTRAGARARSLVESTHPVAGSIRMTGPPVRMSDTPGIRASAGAAARRTHGRDPAERLGMSGAEIANSGVNGRG